MKKIACIILLSFTMISYAQDGHDVKKRKMKFTAEQQAVLQTKQMVLELDLSSSQQQQMLSINKKQAQMREKLIQQHKAMKDREEKPSQDEIFKMKNDLLDARIANQAEVKKILNEKQFEQWRVSSKKMVRMKKEKMHKKHKEHREHSKMKHKS